MSPLIDVVYRGPFQGRRVRFVLDALDELGANQRLLWLNPDAAGAGSPISLDGLTDDRPMLAEAVELDGRMRSLPSTVRALRDARRERPRLVVAVGFTSLYAARVVAGDRLLWCVNGIPEERLLYHDSRRHRTTVQALWRGARIGRRPDAVLTVSNPMADLIADRIGDVQRLVVPTVVDRTVFQPRPPGPGRLTYMGSGAPWQDLPLLADLWAAIHAIEPETRFRVVTKDPRAHMLGSAVPSDAVEFTEARGPAAVAAQLRDSQLGFVVRRPHLVNQVSYPTKFGEYVASGVGVVTTDIGWDIAELTRATGCGVVLDVEEPTERLAAHVVDALRRSEQHTDALVEACDQAAATLDAALWVKQLGASLKQLVE
jgi:hypothetical protein